METSPETASHQSLPINLMAKLLSLVRELVSSSWQTAVKHLPQLKSTVGKVVETATARVEGVLPHVNKGVEYIGDMSRKSVLYLAATGGNYVWETIKRHPWMSGSLLLLLLCYCFSKPGAPGKMMKAPGKGGATMRRSAFEGDTRGYFRELRGKGSKRS